MEMIFMDWFKSIFEINDIYKPLIPFGIILAFANLDLNSTLIYILALSSIIVGIVGLFLKNMWTKLIAGLLFASTGSYMVLSLYSFYSSHFGGLAGIIVILIALLIIIGGLNAVYHAIVGEEIIYEEDHDQEYSDFYDDDDFYEE